MSRVLRVLMVEDSEDDAETILRELRRHGFTPYAERVEDAASMDKALAGESWDVILSDCAMPRFSADEALAVMHGKGLDVPFLLVSGTIAEETAAAAMRAGAHDFVRKDTLARLGPAVEREIGACERRRVERRAQKDLCISEARYRELFAHCPLPMWVYDGETLEVVAANRAASQHYGYASPEFLRLGLADLVVSEPSAGSNSLPVVPPSSGPWRHRRRDGSVVTVPIKSQTVEFENGRTAIMVVHELQSDVAPVPIPSVAFIEDVAWSQDGRVTPPAADPAVVVGASILVVDPHARLSGDIEGALASRGYTVEVASDASSIRPRLDAPQFDVIIADVSFPATGALGFMRAVRERDLDVPVVFVADRADGQKAAEAIEYGAFRVVRRPVDSETLLTIVRHAIGLHRIATLKRQAIEVTGADRHRLGDRAGLEVRFDNALTKLWLAFQPIVQSTKQAVFGYEAFVRSDEPALPTPSELFSAAEHLGRLHDLGRAIRTEVANAATAAPPDVRIFVNVHADDLADFDLFSPAAPLSAIANRVVLEITDRSSLYRVTNLPARLAKLRALGFRICVDDLGAGYAGLSCFSQLEPEFGKLDGSLVRGVQASARRRGVLRSMLELMGVDLGMVVVCEGVEIAEERATLIELGADLLQGRLFAPPSRDFVVPSQ